MLVVLNYVCKVFVVISERNRAFGGKEVSLATRPAVIAVFSAGRCRLQRVGRHLVFYNGRSSIIITVFIVAKELRLHVVNTM